MCPGSRSLDLDHHSVVQEPVEQSGGDDRIAAEARLEARIIEPFS
jgi:hypothetical protein